jgi:hypothetical protein
MDFSSIFNPGSAASTSFDWSQAAALPSFTGGTSVLPGSWSSAGNSSSTGAWSFPAPGTSLSSIGGSSQPSAGEQFLQTFLKSGLSSLSGSLGGGSMSDIARLAGVPSAMGALDAMHYQGLQIPIARATAELDRFNNLRRAQDQATVFGPLSRTESMLDNQLARNEGERNLEVMYGPKGGRTWADVMSNPGGTVSKRGSFNGMFGGRLFQAEGLKYV